MAYWFPGRQAAAMLWEVVGWVVRAEGCVVICGDGWVLGPGAAACVGAGWRWVAA